MSLNISKGNMYDFVTHTWNTVKGKCFHDCSYCYMKRFKNQKEIRFDEKELKTDLGKGNFIFVGSSNDLFAKNISIEWIEKTMEYCNKFDNKYFLQSKNTQRIWELIGTGLFKKVEGICTTIETNRFYPEIMNNCVKPEFRAFSFGNIKGIKKYVTIEPILDFDLIEMVDIIKECEPYQVNIGADSGNNHLPEPSKEKLLQLIKELEKFTVIHSKRNLNRLLV